MEKSIPLSELQHRIQRVVESQLAEACWVIAEISEIKVNYAGHCYLELVERPNEGKSPVAQARAVIWSTTYKMISGYFRFQTNSDLCAGMKILAKCRVNFHPVYGLSLVIQDLDPAYTLGETERIRRETIARLQEEGVYDMNRDFTLPDVIQRIAVISSAQAAGYRDFTQELKNSPYRFDTDLYSAVMQGEASECSIIDALDKVAASGKEYDALVLIRGGGSTSDLGCFDNYRLCCYIAQFPLPVITGIGHDKDTSVADMVAHTSLKTPTAVATFLVERARETELRLNVLGEQLGSLSRQLLIWQTNRIERAGILLSSLTERNILTQRARIDEQKHRLNKLAARKIERSRQALELLAADLKYGAEARLMTGGYFLRNLRERLHLSAKRAVETQQIAMEGYTQAVESADPARIIARGYAVLRQRDKIIKSVSQTADGEPLSIQLRDGTIEAKIIGKTK